MPTLSEITYEAPQAQAEEEPYIKCEICGADVPQSQARSIKVMYAVAGPEHPSFECPAVQHWACCHEHAKQAAIACIEEHLDAGPHGGA